MCSRTCGFWVWAHGTACLCWSTLTTVVTCSSSHQNGMCLWDTVRGHRVVCFSVRLQRYKMNELRCESEGSVPKVWLIVWTNKHLAAETSGLWPCVTLLITASRVSLNIPASHFLPPVLSLAFPRLSHFSPASSLYVTVLFQIPFKSFCSCLASEQLKHGSVMSCATGVQKQTG